MRSLLSGRRGSGARGWLVAVAITLASTLAVPPLASADLPDGRVWEMVTNPFKEGFAPTVVGYTDDGDTVQYSSAGSFLGEGLGGAVNQYLAARQGTVWKTTALNPSGPTYAALPTPWVASSTDLTASVWAMRHADESAAYQDFYRRATDGDFTRVGPAFNPATVPPAPPGTVTTTTFVAWGASSDLSHVLYTIGAPAVFSGDTTGPNVGKSLYEYVGTGNEHPRLVGVDNTGSLVSECDTAAGSSTSDYHTISTDGRVVFFSPQSSGGTSCGSVRHPSAAEVWARIDGTTSIKASASLCTRTAADPGGACNAQAVATFEGASADGSRVYFTTTQQLVNGDTDTTKDLYACDIPSGTPAPSGTSNPCSALSEVSGAATGANVQGVVRISADGSRVYFVARGVLAANTGANGAGAVANDNNLYVWEKDSAHPSGTTTFVGKLATNDTPLWGSDNAVGRQAQATDDGRYLVLSTFSPLINSGTQADTDTAQDVYRYDAQTGALVRVSVDFSGSGGNGAGLNATFTAASYVTATPTARERTAMTADASTIIFITSEGLQADDSNAQPDVYEWRNGQVSLISSGKAYNASPLGLLAYITSSGDDIYFTSTEQLTSIDGDTVPDLYDARVGGSLPSPPPPVCTLDPDTCHPSTPISPVLGEPNTGAPGTDDSPGAEPTFSLQAVSAEQLRKLASTGKLTLSLTGSAAGTFTARATATVAHKKNTSVGSGRATLSASGTASLRLALSKKARTQLSTDGKLTVRVEVGYSKVATTTSTTLKLTHAKAKKKAAKHKKKPRHKHTTAKRSSTHRATGHVKGAKA